MKVEIPTFREGNEWRRLSSIERGESPWKYVLLKDVFVGVETGLKCRYDCISNGVIYMTLLPHGIIMRKGYSWNGNTASPDRLCGQWMLVESLPHDGIFQFSGVKGFPSSVITLSWANWLYLKMSPKWIGWAYYAGLSVGSWAAWGQQHEGDKVEIKPLPKPEPV